MQRVFTVTQEIIDRYGAINGDRDIIHYDADYAAQRGFRGTLAHGLMVQGYANVLAIDLYGTEWMERGEIEVKFVRPVFPGDDVTVEIGESGTLTASNADGPVMVGTARLRPDAAGETATAGQASAT